MPAFAYRSSTLSIQVRHDVPIAEQQRLGCEVAAMRSVLRAASGLSSLNTASMRS